MSDQAGAVGLPLPTLRMGPNSDSSPTPVVRLQHVLNDLGHGPLVEDGDFGPKTDAAVKAFQGNQGLTTDGVVGTTTWTNLLTIWLLSSEGC